MTRWIVAGSIRFRLLVVAVAVATMVVGANRLRSMPVDVLPEFVPPTVEIQTEALGLSAAEVEQLITVPMEQDLLNGVAFLDDIRSQSVPGLSRILLVFEPGTNLFRARQVVAERLTQAHALPQVSKPPQMLQPLSSTNRVLMIGLSSEKVSALEMSVQARCMGIADIFEALTAKDRPYKKKKTVGESLTILGKFKLGGHIDPDLFDVFMWEKVYEKYAREFLDPDQLDEIDLAKIPGYTPPPAA